MRKLALCLALVLALPASAADHYHLRDYVTNDYGSALSGVYVYIYDPPNQTTTTATAYTDLAGGTAVTYPLTTDSNGMFECYLASGNYDINVVHSGHSIDDTWDNYMVGAAASIDSLAYVAVDTIKGATDDTVHVRASDGARHGVLKVNNIMLEDALGHNHDIMAIRYGPSTSGTENPNARLYLPYYGVFYMTRSGYNIRVPQMDGSTYTNHMALGIGGTTGNATNWQFWEDVELNWAHPYGDSTAATGSRYHETPVIGFERRLRPLDSAYTTADTLRCDAYQSLDIRNDRSGRLNWFWVPRGYAGSPPDTLHGLRGGPYGTPDYAIKLRTDLPDSNGTEGYREAVVIQWVMDPNSGEIRNTGSSFLTMYEHNTENYVFTRDALELRPSKEGSVNKRLMFYGTGGAYSKLMMTDTETAFNLYAVNRLFNIYDYDGSDDARLKVAQVYTDTLKAKSGTTAYIRAADGQNDATLEVDNITLSGELGGARVWLPFGEAGGFVAARALDWAGNNCLSETGEGAPMMGSGSVVGVSIRANIGSWSAGDSLDVQVRVNNSVVFSARKAVSGKGYMSAEATQARGIDTFSAGDYIRLYVPMGADTLTIGGAGVSAIVDLQLDD